jgi:hypothetical protein
MANLQPRKVYDEVAIPTVLDLEKNIETTLSFLNEVSYKVTEERVRVRLNLSKLSVISPDAAICLASSFLALQQTKGSAKTVTGTYPESPTVELQLQQSGFFSMLGVKHRLPSPPSAKDYDWFPPQSGKITDGVTIDLLQDRLFGVDTHVVDELSMRIYRAVTEAMANVVEHAYAAFPENKISPWLRSRWWMSGHLDKRDGVARIFLRDLGVGVPKSLSDKVPIDALNRLITWSRGEGFRDVDLLQAAMVLGRSGTELPFRGKGMQDMLTLAKGQPGGRLRVISGFGDYACQENGSERRIVLENAMVGTFVEWTLPLKQTGVNS